MISVIVCTYNRSQVLAQALRSLAQMTLPADVAWELLVVDNNSHDDTRTVVEEFARTSRLNVRYVFEPAQGLSHARNRGIQEARGEILAFTDDDATVDPFWLAQLRNAFAAPGCMAVGGKIIPVWNCPKPAWFSEGPVHNMASAIVHFDLGELPCRMHESPWGANMAFRQEVFAKYGVFRTDLGRTKDSLASMEEVEIFKRLFSAGEAVMYEPAAKVYHPVDEQRLNQRYILSYYYAAGRSEIRALGMPWRGVCYWGFPGYYLRLELQYLFAWLVTANPERRFQKKVRAYKLAGQLMEYRRLHQARATESSAAGGDQGECAACEAQGSEAPVERVVGSRGGKE